MNKAQKDQKIYPEYGGRFVRDPSTGALTPANDQPKATVEAKPKAKADEQPKKETTS